MAAELAQIGKNHIPFCFVDAGIVSCLKLFGSAMVWFVPRDINMYIYNIYIYKHVYVGIFLYISIRLYYIDIICSLRMLSCLVISHPTHDQSFSAAQPADGLAIKN